MRTLLIADDERIIREGLAGSLDWQELGISEVHMASDGEEALQIVRRQKIDIALVDIEMPEMNALQLIEQCRRDACSTEFIIITGYDNFKYAQKAIQCGVFDYLLKPCDPDQLRQVIEKLLAKQDQADRFHSLGEQASKQLTLLLPHAQAQLLRELIERRSASLEDIDHIRQALHLSDGFYRIILFPLHDYNADEKTTLELYQRIRANYPDTSALIDDDALLLLSAAKSRDEAAILADDVKLILKSCRQAFDTPIISQPGSLDRISTLYGNCRAFRPVIDYFQDADLVFQQDFRLASQIEDDLVESYLFNLTHAISSNQAELACTIVNSLRDFCRIKLLDFDLAKELCVRTIVMIIRENLLTVEDHSESIRLITAAWSVNELFSLLSREVRKITATRKKMPGHNFSKPVQQVIDYINLHLADSSLSLNQIASGLLFMSPDYLGKLFKKECGIKFNNYLLAARMKKAEQLLRSTDDRIYEIAEKVGFGDNPTYFSQLFKQYTGRLPKEFRLQRDVTPGANSSGC